MSAKQSGFTQQFADGTEASPSIQIGRPDTGFYVVRDSDGIPIDILFSVAGSAASLSDLTSGFGAAAIQIQYMDAVATAAFYHMVIAMQDTDTLADIVSSGAASDAVTAEHTALQVRANLLKADLRTHILAGGALRTFGAEHLLADTALADTLALVPAASNQATTCTLAIAIGVALIGHGNSAGVHFHDDTTTGSGYTATSDLAGANATYEKARVELNALRLAIQTHTNNGVAIV